MHSHLITVKISIEGRADQRMYLDRLAFNQYRLERLNAEAVQRRRAIKQHRMLADDFLQNVPDDRLLPLNHFPRLLDRGRMALFFQLVVDKWLEQFQSHLLGQTTLMQFEFGTHNYY